MNGISSFDHTSSTNHEGRFLEHVGRFGGSHSKLSGQLLNLFISLQGGQSSRRPSPLLSYQLYLHSKHLIMSHATLPPFLRLPLELRLEIYSYLLISPDPRLRLLDAERGINVLASTGVWRSTGCTDHIHHMLLFTLRLAFSLLTGKFMRKRPLCSTVITSSSSITP